MSPAESPVVCAVVVTLDPITTYLAVSAGAVEAHPLWHTLIVSVGLAPAMIIRALAGIALVAAVAVAIAHDGNPLTSMVLRVLTLVFAIIVAWNIVAWSTA